MVPGVNHVRRSPNWELGLRKRSARARSGSGPRSSRRRSSLALVGLDGRWLRVNRKLCDIVGYEQGIVGLPNAGKSTLFNALTAAGAETGDYPFTTIDPNVAVVEVPDERLDRIAELLGSSSIVRETIEFHDIAGLVRGASAGEGLGNRSSPRSARPTRSATWSAPTARATSPHPEGRVDPVADAELIETELLAADLEQARAAAGADDQARRARATRRRSPSATGCEAVVEALRVRPAGREVPVPEAAADALRKLAPADREAGPLRRQRRRGRERGAARARRARGRRSGAGAVAISARVEAELRELDARPRPRRCGPSSGSSARASTA